MERCKHGKDKAFACSACMWEYHETQITMTDEEAYKQITETMNLAHEMIETADKLACFQYLPRIKAAIAAGFKDEATKIATFMPECGSREYAFDLILRAFPRNSGDLI
jgi:hypothetical protein